MMDGFKGTAGPAGTNSVQSKPDGCSSKVVVGQKTGKLFWAGQWKCYTTRICANEPGQTSDGFLRDVPTQ